MSAVTTAFSKFTEKELKCKGTGEIRIDPRFADKITEFREKIWCRPITPTSVCRSPLHNKAVGGHPTSLHLTVNPHHGTEGTAAMDCYWANIPKSTKLEFAALAYKAGFSVGLSSIFCHLDLRTITKLKQHCFLYTGDWDNKVFTTADVVRKSQEL